MGSVDGGVTAAVAGASVVCRVTIQYTPGQAV